MQHDPQRPPRTPESQPDSSFFDALPPPAEDDTRPTNPLPLAAEPALNPDDTHPTPATPFHLIEPPIEADDTQPTPLAPMQPVVIADRTPPGGVVALGAFVPLSPPVPRRWRLWLAAAGVLLLFCVGGAVALLLARGAGADATAADSMRVSVIADGRVYEQDSRAATVGDLLREMQIRLGPNDVLLPPADTPLTPGLEVLVARARVVTLVIDGAFQQVQTTEQSPLRILQDSGVTLDPDDRVWIDGTLTTPAALANWLIPPLQIQVRRAVTLTVVDGDTQRSLRTSADTVGEALFEAGITLFLADSVTPELNTPVSEGLLVTVDRSRAVTVEVDGRRMETRVSDGTVADALVAAGVTLVGLDYSVPSESAPIVPGMVIRVIRVTEEVQVEQAAIPFETVYQADASLELDQQSVLQAGQNGVAQTNIRVRYENGMEISRQAEPTFVAQEPVNRVIGYGTQVVIRTLDTPDGPVQYWRMIRMYATSYHPAALGGDNITATGATLTRGIVGADPDVLPYHTRIYVAGYGVGQIEDTGGPRRSARWVDLGYDDENWVGWSEYVDVYVLVPVPQTINYILPE